MYGDGRSIFPPVSAVVFCKKWILPTELVVCNFDCLFLLTFSFV